MLPSCVVSVRVEREAQKAKSRGKGNPDSSSLLKKQVSRGLRSVGAFRAPPLPPAPVWHLLGAFRTWGFAGLGCGRPPGPRRYASVIFAFKLDPLVSDLRSQSQKSEGQTSACRIDDMGNSD